MNVRISTLVSAMVALSMASAAQGAEPQRPQGAEREDAPAGASVCDVRKFGAVGDGVRLDTGAIQKAVDACAAAGGGTVTVPPGKYLSGTVFLKSNVTLDLAAGAAILGSTNLADYATGIERCGFVLYPQLDKCLIYASQAENVAITGRGTIDGQGRAFPLVTPDGAPGERPMLLRLASCRNVSLEGVTLQNAGAWCAHFLGCDGVRVRGVTIHNRVNGNNDGIDLMNTRKVLISDCILMCEDDCVCFQNMSHDLPVQDIVITNCLLSTRWAAIRSGGSHRGGIRNVAVSNCVIRDTFGCGIKLQVSGNGTLENLTFSNIVMENVSCPISLRFGSHHYNGEKRDPSFPFGAMRNILFANIRASVPDEASLKKAIPSFYAAYPWKPPPQPCPGEERQCISICGIPGHPVEGVTLRGIHVTYPGGGTREDAERRELPELEEQYPEYFMWGVLPAYGLYARHVKGLSLESVQFDVARSDFRPAVVCDDAEDVDISGLRARGNLAAESLIRLRSTRDAFVHDCRLLGEAEIFLRAEGRECRQITLIGNALQGARRTVETAAGAEAGSVKTGERP
jgi:parallel beta-helix repeat protein